ncbi:LEPR-XLL domain-containing protein [Bradyrhizobium sp. USDA 376]
MGIAWRWNKEAHKRSVFETLLNKVIREIIPGRDSRRRRRTGSAASSVAKPRRQNFTLEAIEPRLLLSADISYATIPNPSVHEFTLQASGSSSLTLFETGTSNVAGTAALTDNNVTIERSGGSIAQAGFGDTIHIDLDTFSALNGFVGGGGTLNINFTGGDQRLFQDTVKLDGASAVLNFGLNLTADSAISSSAHAAFGGSLTLASQVTAGNDPVVNQGILADANSGITLTGANLTASSVAFTAHSALDVDADGSVQGNADDSGFSGKITGKIADAINDNLGNNIHLVSLVTSFSSAKIDIGDSILSATAGDLTLAATVDGTLKASSVNNGSFKITLVAGEADPEVLIHGASSHVNASGKIGATAKSDVTINASAAPGSGSDASKDAAVALTVFDSGAKLGVSGGATVNATGASAATLQATSKLNATTLADGSAGSAGAAVAVSVIFGDTTASIDGATVDGTGVTLAAGADRTIMTSASSSVGGSSDGGGGNASQKTLGSNGATTNEGSITFAGAVAVGVDTGTASSFINAGTIDARTGAVAVTTTTRDVQTVGADASFTGDTSGNAQQGVGIAVAIGVADRSNLAYIDGNTTITGSSLVIDVLAPQQSVFTVTSISGIGTAENLTVDGSVALNFVFNHNYAYLAKTANVTLSSPTNVTIEAESNIALVTRATPADSKGDPAKTGVGISVALGYDDDTTSAYLDDGAVLAGAKDLTLIATSIHTMETDAMNGAVGKSTSVTPVIAISISDNDVSAKLGTGGELDIGGAFTASATLTDQVTTSAEGDTQAGTAIGISIGLSFVNDHSLATTGRDLVTTGGAAAFLSNAISISETRAKASAAGGEDETKNNSNGGKSIDQKTTGQKNFANSAATSKNSNAKGTGATDTNKASSGGGNVTVAGAVALDVQNATSTASISDNRKVTATGLLTVHSALNSDGHATADGKATTESGGTGVGLGVAIALNNPTNLGYIGNNTDIHAGGVIVEAVMDERKIDAPVIKPDVVNTTDDTIFVGLGSGLKNGDRVEYLNFALSGDIGGLTNLSQDYYVHVNDDGTIRLYDSKAKAEAGETTGANKQIDLTSPGSGDQHFYKVEDVMGVPTPNPLSDVKFTAGGTVRLLNLGANAHLRTGDSVTYDVPPGSTAIGGLSSNTVYYVIDLTGGHYQLAASRNEAYAGKALELTSDGNGTRVVDESHSSRAEALSAAGSGDIGVSVSVAVNVVNNETEAVIGKTPSGDHSGTSTAKVAITGGLDVAVRAGSSEDNLSRALPHGDTDGENVGVGASVAVDVPTNTVNAAIINGTTWSGAAGQFTVSAENVVSTFTHGENGAAGGVGVAVGAGILVASDTVSAYVGTGGTVSATGDASITASNEVDYITETDAEAAGKSVGVGASIAIAWLTENVSAELARSVTTTGGAATVASSSTVVSETTALASAKGKDDDSGSGNNADKQADGQVNGSNASTNSKGVSLPSAGGNASSGNSSASSQGGQNDSGVSVAASIAVNRILADNTAKVTNGADITAQGAVMISAVAQYDGSAKAIGTGVKLDGDDHIAAGVSVNWLGATNKALVGGGSIIISHDAVAGITLEAITPSGETNDFVAWGAAAAGGKGGMSIAGSVAINIVDHFDTEASTASTSHLESDGGIAVNGTAVLGPQTLAAAGAFSKDKGAFGAAINVTLLHATVTAAIGGDADAAGAISVNAESHMVPTEIDLPLLKPKLTSVAVAGSASQADLAVAGSFIINDLHVDVDAHIGAFSQINQGGLYTVGSGQTVTVGATNETKVVSVAGALALSIDSSGFGVGLDVEILHKTTKAYIGSSAHVGNNGGGAVTVTATSPETMLSVAGTIGGGFGGTGAAASVGIADIHPQTDAYIDDSAQVRSGGAISVTATDTFITTMVAGAIGVGNTAGIGLANTTLVHNATVQAYVGANATLRAGGNIDVIAKESEDIITIAAGFGGGGDVGVAGSAAINVLTEHTTASIGHGTSVTVVGVHDLTVKATDDTAVTTVAGSIAASGTAGVGVGVGVGVFKKFTTAFIDSNVTATVGGNILVAAASTETLISVSAGIAVGGTVGVGANADVNVFELHTRAFIGDDPTDGTLSFGQGNVHATGTVAISADDQTDINEIAAVLAAGTVGIGAAAGVNVMTKDIEAFIGSGAVVTGDGQGVGADVNTGAIGITLTPVNAGDKFSPDSPKGQGIETSDSSTSSNAESDDPVARSNLRSGGHVGTPALKPMKTSSSGSGDQDVSDDSLSNIRSAGPTVQSGFHGVAVAATNQDEIRTFTFSVGAGEVGVAVTAGVDVVNATTKAYIGDHATVNGSTATAAGEQTVLVGAAADFYHLAIAGSAAGGLVGVAPAVGVNVIGNTTEAYIGDHATVNALGDIGVAANAKENVVMIGFGIAGGFVGVGGAVDVLSVSNTTKAHIDDHAVVFAHGDVLVSAADDTHVLELSGALAGGAVGVGGSVGVMLIHKDTEAFIAANAQVDGLGKSAGQGNILDGTIGSGFGRTTAHGVLVQAESKEDLLHIVAAGAGGFVGVSGAVGVTLISGETDASILDGALINTAHEGSAASAQSVHVGAADDVSVKTFVIGIGAGFVGVSGAVDVGTVNNNVKAVVGANATVNAAADIDVYALSLKDIEGFDASGAGGFVGVGGAVSVWSIGKQIEKTGKDKDGNATSDSALDAKPVSFGTGAVDTGDGTIDFGKPTFGDGAEVIYHSGGGSDLGSVHDGDHVFLHQLLDGSGHATGKVELYNSALNAQNHNGTGLIALSQAGNDNQSFSNVNGSADSDAAAEAEAGKNQVTNSNAGGINNFTSDGKANSNRDRISQAISGPGGATAGINAKAPTKTGITNTENSAPPPAADPLIPNGTSAIVKGGAHLNAGLAINVGAHESDIIKVTTGQAAVGFVGAGAAVAVLSLGNNVTAFADGTLSAGLASDINVNASLNESVNLLALDAAGGFVGVGAAVVVISDTSLVQASLGNVTQAADVKVSATNTRDLTELTAQVSAGAVAAGVSYTSLDVTGGASATVDGSAEIGKAGVVKSLTVDASDTTTTDVHTVAVSAGLVATGVNFARVSDKAVASAAIGDGAKVIVTGDVTVNAESVDLVNPFVEGVEISLGAGAGLSFVKADVETAITASIGNGSVSARKVSVTTSENLGKDTSYGSSAEAQTSAGGTLLGAEGGVATAIMSPTMESKITGTVTATDAVTISATDNSNAVASAHGIGLGGLGIGVTIATAETKSSVKAHLDGSVITASELNIYATGTEAAKATETAVVGGILFTLDINSSTARVAPDVEAYVQSGGSINTTGKIEVLAIDHPEGDALTKGFGLSGGAQIGEADSTTDITPTVKAYIDPPTVTAGGNITVMAKAEPQQTKTPPNYQIINTETSDDLANPLNNSVEVTNHGLQTGSTVVLPSNAGIDGLTVNGKDNDNNDIIIKTVIRIDDNHLAFGDVFDGAKVDPTTDIITLPSAVNLNNGDLIEYEPAGGVVVDGLTPGHIYSVYIPNPLDPVHIKLREPGGSYVQENFTPPASSQTIDLTNHQFFNGEAVTYHAPAAHTFVSVQVDVDPNSAIFNSGSKTYNNVDNNNIQYVDANGDAASWGFALGDIVRYEATGGKLPIKVIDGLTDGADYKVVTVGGPNSSSIQLGDASSLGMGNITFTRHGTGDTITRTDGHNWSDFGFKDGQTLVISATNLGSNNRTVHISSGSGGSTLTLTESNTVNNDTTAAKVVIGLNPGTKDQTNPDFTDLKAVTHSLVKKSDLPMTADGNNADGKQFYVEKLNDNQFKLHLKADLSDTALTLSAPGATGNHTIGAEAVDIKAAGSGLQQLRVNLKSGPAVTVTLTGPGGTPLNVISPPTGDGVSSAVATGSGGGVLLGANITHAVVNDNPDVEAYITR